MEILEHPDDVLRSVLRSFHQSLDLETTVAGVAREVAAAFADWCVVDLLDDRGVIRRSAVTATDGSPESLRAAMFRWAPDPAKPRGVHHVMETRAPLIYPTMTDEIVCRTARGPGHLEMMRALAARSYVCLPLVVDEQLIGSLLCLVTRREGAYAERHLPVLTDVAGHAALAIHHAARHTRAARDLETHRELLAMTAHDVANGVGSVILTADALLRRDGAGERFSRHRELSRIKATAQSVATLASGLVECHASDPVGGARVTEVTAALEECVDLVRVAAELRGVRLQLEAAGEPLAVEGAPTKVKQVVMNLLGNAVKFTPRGGVVAVRAAPEEEGAAVEVSVTDSGVGIPPDAVARLFERGWQANRGGGEGHGLGLWIVKKLVDDLGGRISVRSDPAVGSTFAFRLPRAGER